MPQSVGLIGKEPNHAFWFNGYVVGMHSLCKFYIHIVWLMDILDDWMRNNLLFYADLNSLLHNSQWILLFSDDELIFLDPHKAQPIVDITTESTDSYHCRSVSRNKFQGLWSFHCHGTLSTWKCGILIILKIFMKKMKCAINYAYRFCHHWYYFYVYFVLSMFCNRVSHIKFCE